jgi:hypothetical protein
MKSQILFRWHFLASSYLFVSIFDLTFPSMVGAKTRRSSRGQTPRGARKLWNILIYEPSQGLDKPLTINVEVESRETKKKKAGKNTVPSIENATALTDIGYNETKNGDEDRLASNPVTPAVSFTKRPTTVQDRNFERRKKRNKKKKQKKCFDSIPKEGAIKGIDYIDCAPTDKENFDTDFPTWSPTITPVPTLTDFPTKSPKDKISKGDDVKDSKTKVPTPSSIPPSPKVAPTFSAAPSSDWFAPVTVFPEPVIVTTSQPTIRQSSSSPQGPTAITSPAFWMMTPSSPSPLSLHPPSNPSPIAATVPTTKSPVTIPSPTTKLPVTIPSPTTKSPVTIPSPTTKSPVTIPSPTTKSPVTIPSPTTESPITIPSPTTKSPVTIPSPTTESPTQGTSEIQVPSTSPLVTDLDPTLQPSADPSSMPSSLAPVSEELPTACVAIANGNVYNTTEQNRTVSYWYELLYDPTSTNVTFSKSLRRLNRIVGQFLTAFLVSCPQEQGRRERHLLYHESRHRRNLAWLGIGSAEQNQIKEGQCSALNASSVDDSECYLIQSSVTVFLSKLDNTTSDEATDKVYQLLELAFQNPQSQRTLQKNNKKNNNGEDQYQFVDPDRGIVGLYFLGASAVPPPTASPTREQSNAAITGGSINLSALTVGLIVSAAIGVFLIMILLLQRQKRARDGDNTNSKQRNNRIRLQDTDSFPSTSPIAAFGDNKGKVDKSKWTSSSPTAVTTAGDETETELVVSPSAEIISEDGSVFYDLDADESFHEKYMNGTGMFDFEGKGEKPPTFVKADFVANYNNPSTYQPRDYSTKNTVDL